MSQSVGDALSSFLTVPLCLHNSARRIPPNKFVFFTGVALNQYLCRILAQMQNKTVDPVSVNKEMLGVSLKLSALSSVTSYL